jgi:YgiT-type zinc finger domain-containing protein
MKRSDRMCPMCHVGKLQEKKTTFTQVFDGQVIVMPNVSALVCDVCGERTMDPDTLLSLSGLLGIERPGLTSYMFEFPKSPLA